MAQVEQFTGTVRVLTLITSSEWNVLVNPLRPQFSLKWVVTGPDTYTFRRATAADKKRDTAPKNTTGSMSPRQFGRDFSEQNFVRMTA